MKNTGGYKSRLYSITKNKSILSLLKNVYPPAPFVNVIPEFKKNAIRSIIFKDGNRILDIGSGLSKGPGKWLWNSKFKASVEVIRLDICDGPNVDIVADATDLPDDIGVFDIVVLQAVPEHVEDIYKLFDSVKRVVKCGGYIYVEMPFLQGVHGDPSDYWRCTLDGLKYLTKPFSPVFIGVSGGPLGSIIWIISDLFSNLLSYKLPSLLLRFFVRWVLAPCRYFDLLIYRSKATQRLACEYYILVKREL